MNQTTAAPVVQAKNISTIQRYMTNAEFDEGGTNTERIEEDKRIQEKPEVQRKPIFESNEDSAPPTVQRKCATCEKEEMVQKMEGEEEMINEKEESLQRKCANCKEGDDTIQPKSVGGGEMTASSSLQSQLNSTRGGGSALPDNTRTSMESSIGADFSGVRIHTDSSAVQMNKELGAQAFTHGSDVYFNSGKYDASGKEGKKLLSHELTHVVQQNKRISKSEIQRDIIDDNSPSVRTSLPSLMPSPGLELGPGMTSVTISFTYNSTAWSAASIAQVTRLVNTMKFIPTTKVILTGHTSLEGSDEYNQDLSERRAESIRQWLILSGISNDRIITQGMGESIPVSDESDLPEDAHLSLEESRSKNRRVDALIYGLEKSDVPLFDIYKHRDEIVVPDETGDNGGKGKEGKEKSNKKSLEDCSNLKSSTFFFDELPPDLQSVINQSAGEGEFCKKEDALFAQICFSRLDKKRKQGLIDVYKLLCNLGLWKHVIAIEKIVPGEKSIRLGPLRIDPPGLSISVHFITDDVGEINNTLITGRRFCLDHGIGASLHPGQSSFRKEGENNFLHLSTSLKNDNKTDAHIDKYQSVSAIGEGRYCVYDISGSIQHIGREVVPEKFRKYTGGKYGMLIRTLLFGAALTKKAIDKSLLDATTRNEYLFLSGLLLYPEDGIPGFQIAPPMRFPGPINEKDQAAFYAGITLRFEIGGTDKSQSKRIAKPTPSQFSPPTEESSKILEAVKKEMSIQKFNSVSLVAKRTHIGNIEPEKIAESLISKMQYASKQKEVTINFYLEFTGATSNAERKRIVNNFKNIARLVGKYFPGIHEIGLDLGASSKEKEPEGKKKLRYLIFI